MSYYQRSIPKKLNLVGSGIENKTIKKNKNNWIMPATTAVTALAILGALGYKILNSGTEDDGTNFPQAVFDENTYPPPHHRLEDIQGLQKMTQFPVLEYESDDDADFYFPSNK